MGLLKGMARKFLSEMALLLRPEWGPQAKAFQTEHNPRSHNKLGIFFFLRNPKAATWLKHREGGRKEMGWLLQQLHFIKPTN